MTRIVVLDPASVSHDSASGRLMLGNANLQQPYLKDKALAYRDVTAIIKHGHLPIRDIDKNLVKNPSFEVDTSGWSAGTGFSSQSISRITSWSVSGSAALRVTGTHQADTVARHVEALTPTGASGMPVVAGNAYTARAVYNVINESNDSRGLRLQVTWYDSGGASLSTSSSTEVDDTGGGEFTVTHTFTAPTSAAFAALRVQCISATSGDVVDFYIDAVMFTPGTTAPPVFFDGSTPGYTWTGTANASSSQAAISTSDRVGVTVRRKSQIDKLVGFVTYDTLVIQSMVDGTSTTLATQAISSGDRLVHATNYWLRFKATTNTSVTPNRIELELAHFTSDPLALPAPSPLYTLTHNILKEGATLDLYNFFATVNGEPGIYWRQTHNWETAWVDDFTILPSALTDTLLATLTNNGNFRTQPLIRIQGGVTNPSIKNLANNEVIKLVGTIASGSYVDLDIAGRKVVDNAGANKFNLLDMSSDWLELEPGENSIEMSASAVSGTPSVSFFFRDAWM